MSFTVKATYHGCTFNWSDSSELKGIPNQYFCRWHLIIYRTIYISFNPQNKCFILPDCLNAIKMGWLMFSGVLFPSWEQSITDLRTVVSRAQMQVIICPFISPVCPSVTPSSPVLATHACIVHTWSRMPLQSSSPGPDLCKLAPH